MEKKELKEWFDSDEEESSWAESALPMFAIMFLLIVLFISCMFMINPS